MTNISDLEINLDGLQESLKEIEKFLNDIIHNHELSVEEMRTKASLCAKAVNRYTKIANRNVHLLNEQAFYLLKKVQKIQEETQQNGKAGESDYEIH